MALTLISFFLITPAAGQEKGVNLLLNSRSGWSHPVVPELGAVATPSSCWIEPHLANPFWLNAHGENTGNEGTGGGFDVAFYIDGTLRTMGYAPATTGEFTVLNIGPLNLDLSGRHTVSAYVDAFGSISETNEDDNTWGGQFIWPARPLPFSPTVFPAPPPREGGWQHCPDPDILEYNCDGFNVASPAEEWLAVTVRPLEASSQYQIKLYEYGNDESTNGYTDLLEADGNMPGELVGIVLHQGFTLPPPLFDIGIENVTGSAPYRIQAHLPQPLFPGTPFTQEFGPDQDFAFWTFSIPADQLGDKDLILRTDSGHPMRLGHLNPDLEFADLAHQPVAGGPTNSWGLAYTCREYTDSSEHAITAYLDAPTVADPFTFTVEIAEPRANLIPSIDFYWTHPVTPTNTHQTGTGWLPNSLWGDSTTTHLNYLVRNSSHTDTGNFADMLALDGVPYPTVLHFGGLPAGMVYCYNGSSPVSIPGGRHTLSLKTDSGGGVSEIEERDNSYAYQYCWKPSRLPYGNVQTMPPAPLKTGGHSHALPDADFPDNCSALRLMSHNPAGSSSHWWRGMAAMPAEGSNVNVALFSEYTSSTESFAEPLAFSGVGLDEIDFVLVNMNEQPDALAPFEAGFIRESGPGNFTAQAVASQLLDYTPSGSYGPWTMLAEDMLQLHEIHLEIGSLALRLDNLSGEGRLGLALFPPGYPCASRTENFVTTVVAAEEGQDIWIRPGIAAEGYYAIAVFKLKPDDLDQEITYRLRMYPNLSGTEEVPSAVTGLENPVPNPFNPRTSLAFSLERQGHARLAIYDVRGRVVKVLCDGEFPAGRQEFVWQGSNEQGQSASSGVYLARFISGDVVQTRRLTLVR
jgi:hypothetical protein